MPKVLVLDDDDVWPRQYQAHLGASATVIRSTTPQEALRLSRDPEVKVVVIDPRILQQRRATKRLLARLRFSFNGPTIAASGDTNRKALRQLKAVGYSDRVGKWDIPRRLTELLTAN